MLFLGGAGEYIRLTWFEPRPVAFSVQSKPAIILKTKTNPDTFSARKRIDIERAFALETMETTLTDLETKEPEPSEYTFFLVKSLAAAKVKSLEATDLIAEIAPLGDEASAAIEKRLEVAGRPEARVNLVHALGNIFTSDSCDLLYTILMEDSHSWVRKEARESFGQCPRSVYSDDIRRRMASLTSNSEEQDDRDDRRVLEISTLLGNGESLDYMRNEITDGDAANVILALKMIGELAAAELNETRGEALDALIDYILDPALAPAAAQIIVEAGAVELVPDLVDIAEDDIELDSVRCAAIQALGSLGSDEAADSILFLLDDEESSAGIWTEAAKAVSRLNSEEIYADIAGLIDLRILDWNPDQKRAIQTALKNGKERAIPSLLDALDMVEETEAFTFLADTVASIGGATAQQKLGKYMRIAHIMEYPFTEAVIDAYGKVAGEDAMPEMTKLWNIHPSVKIDRRVIAVVTNHCPEGAEKIILEAINSEEPDLRRAGIRGTKKLGYEWAPRVLSMLMSFEEDNSILDEIEITLESLEKQDIAG